MSSARAAAPAGEEGDKGRVASTKVSRYWAGKRPDTVVDATVEDHSAAVFENAQAPAQRTPIAAAVVVKKADPRLARLARTDVNEARNEATRRHRREIQAATVVRRDWTDSDAQPSTSAAAADAAGSCAASLAADASHTEKDASGQAAEQTGGTWADAGAGASGPGQGMSDVEAQRQARRMRALQLQRQREADEAQAREEAESSEYETEDDSEYETDDSDDEEEGRLVKPVFVAKTERDTIAERERLEMEEQLNREAELKRKESRVKETSALVAAIVDSEKAAAREKVDGPTNSPSDVDTDSDEDEEIEFNLWQRRELSRIKREQAMRDGVPADNPAAQERAMLAAMTEEEREAYARKHAPVDTKGARNKLRFMQKYYHKGAFFQEAADDDRGTVGGDEIYRRDFSAPTGEDKFDKEALPAVMQVRNFGRAGRTKWTHLAAEDTTALAEEEPAYDFTGEAFGMIKRKMEGLGAGMSQEFVKPKKTKT